MGKVKARASRWYEYDYSKGTIRFTRRWCPRCGVGVAMAYHREPVPRWACGRCGYTIYEKRQ